MSYNGKIHLANDTEKFVWSMFESVSMQPDTTEYRLREKLLKIVKRWKSNDYRIVAIGKQASFYLDLYNPDLGEDSAFNNQMSWAYCRCVDLVAYLEKQG